MGKRGQVAMEFLMTYGWAILIILIAVGALWMLGVFSPNVSTNCSIDPPFSCQDVLIDEGGVSLRLALAEGFTGSVSSVQVNGEDCDELYGAEGIKGGRVVNVRCVKPTLEKEEAVSIVIEALSSKPGGFSKPVEGSATGEVKRVSPTQSLDPTMVAAYDFEEGAKDVSGNDHDGAIEGANCQVDGVKGLGCEFDGMNDYIKASGFSDLGTSNQPYTLEGWIMAKPTETDGNIIHMSGASDGRNWCLSPVVLDGGKVRGHSWTGGSPGSPVSVYSTTPITSGAWYHFANTWDPANGLRIYINGASEGTTPMTIYSASGVSNYIWFGFTPTACSGDEGWFNGFIDEVVIYNRALSPEEIKAHASA